MNGSSACARGLLGRLSASARRWLPRLFLTLVTVGFAPHGGAQAQTPPPTAVAAPAGSQLGEAGAKTAEAKSADTPQANTVYLNKRRIVSFRASFLGDSATERADAARQALEAAVDNLAPAVAAGKPVGVVTRTAVGDALRFDLDGNTLFFLLPDDLSGARSPALLDAAAQKVAFRLDLALQEAREMADPRQWAVGAAYFAAATAVLVLLLRGLFAARRRLSAWLRLRLQRWRQAHETRTVVRAYAGHAQTGAQFAAGAVMWLLVVLAVDIWATFVLRQFAYTRPWGERATAWLLDTLGQFALAAAGALPGLLIAAFIFVMARLFTRANTAFMERVERGELQVGWLDIDTAGPTRRLGNLVVWLFALAMAYPYLPGSGTEAFKGVTVLAGLMLSLGASGVVGQAMSGFSLMYSRSLRVGEYVKIGDTEGTVTAIGLFTTKIHTGLGEEVSVPNGVIFGQPVRNFSRLVQNGQFMLQASVTIGYSTPWRQVHAMLMEAARRTPGVASDPAPYVMQTALSDFYVEYRLCAQGDRSAPNRRAEAINQLLGNIQDVFNENGVQIMSPHYLADPAALQVVPPGDWFPAAGSPLRPPPA